MDTKYIRPDYQNEIGELVERLTDEPDGSVRVRFLDGNEDVMPLAIFEFEWEFIGKDDTDWCEHDVHCDDHCDICD
jgi:hypothetical protein